MTFARRSVAALLVGAAVVGSLAAHALAGSARSPVAVTVAVTQNKSARRSLASAAFTPADVAGMLLDWNADNIVGNDGDALAAWTNDAPTGASGNLAQATGASKPLLKKAANGINGHNVVLFDGTDDFMSSGYQSPAGALTTFIVYKASASAAVNRHVISVADVSASTYECLRFVVFGGYQPFNIINKAAGAPNFSGIADAVDTAAHLFSWTYDNNAIGLPASYTAALDGAAKVVVASSGHTAVAGSRTSLGSFVSPADVGSMPFPGSVGRVIVYSGVVAAGDITSVTSFLRTIYGL